MVVAVALADVVEEESEKDERQAIELARNFGEQRRRILELATAQPLELAHRDQRMRIDRIDVVEVVQDARVEISELGNYRAENAGEMHRLEGFGDSLARRENFHLVATDAQIASHLVVDEAEAVAHQLICAA